MVTTAMTVLPCAARGCSARVSFRGRAPPGRRPGVCYRVVPRLGGLVGGRASRVPCGAWCPRRAATRPRQEGGTAAASSGRDVPSWLGAGTRSQLLRPMAGQFRHDLQRAAGVRLPQAQLPAAVRFRGIRSHSGHHRWGYCRGSPQGRVLRGRWRRGAASLVICLMHAPPRSPGRSTAPTTGGSTGHAAGPDAVAPPPRLRYWPWPRWRWPAARWRGRLQPPGPGMTRRRGGAPSLRWTAPMRG